MRRESDRADRDGTVTEIGDIHGALALSHRAVCGVGCVGWPGVSIPGLSFVLVIAGLIGLGGLALVMGMALSSLAELLALLRPDSCAGSYGGSLGGNVLSAGIRRPHDRALFRAGAWRRDSGRFTHGSDGRAMRVGAR
jgi:hypothetical protein